MAARLSSVLLGLAGLAIFVAAWGAVSASGFVSAAFLPSPAKTWAALVWGFTRGDFAGDLVETVLRMLKGWLLASLVAIAVGCLIGISATARAYLRPTLGFLRVLPASAIVPVAIALFGLTPGMVLGVVVFGSSWPTLLATVQGFASVETRLVEVAQLLQMPRLHFVWKVGLPNAVPDIMTGMRLSLTVALILAVVGEILSAQRGLGLGLLLAARSFHAADLFAGIVLLGGIGLASSYLLQVAERRIVRWRQ